MRNRLEGIPFPVLLLATALCAARPTGAAGQDFERFLDGGTKPAPPPPQKPLPAGARILWAPKAAVRSPVWFPDSRRIACLASEGGDSIWLVDLRGGTPRRIGGHPGPKSSLRMLPDGRLLYVSGSGTARTIRLLAPDDGRDRPVGAGWNPDPSPDGKELVADTPRGPVVLSLDDPDKPPVMIPLPPLRTVEDAFPRLAAGDKILYVQEGHVYVWDRRSGQPDRIAARNMQDLTFYVAAIPSPEGRRAALFSTNASALSKPASTWLVAAKGADRAPREVCPGRPLQWGGNRLLVLNAGALGRIEPSSGAAMEVLVQGALGGALSSDGRQLVAEYLWQDTNGDGQVNWRDGASLLHMALASPSAAALEKTTREPRLPFIEGKIQQRPN